MRKHFFWKKVPPVHPFMGPVRLEKFEYPGWNNEKSYRIWYYKVFCQIETKLESTSQKNKQMFKLTFILF